jgi:hypothetical protein
MNTGGTYDLGFAKVKYTIAFHSSSLPDGSYGGMPNGFIITAPDGRKIYFAGDTALFGDMRLYGDEGLEVAILPIGDHYTMGVNDSIRATKLLTPRVVVPMHYNTFPPIAQDSAAWAERISTETQAKPKPSRCNGNLTPQPSLHEERGSHRAFIAPVLILALFVMLVINHAAALPLFEASDEAPHFLYAHRLAETGQLPVIPTRDELDAAAAQGDVIGQWAIESHQPPLYYALGAVLIAPTTTRADLPAYLVSNDVIFTWGIAEGNPNVWLHPVHDTGGDTARAVWMVRVLSLVLGCGTLMLLYQTVILASDSRAAALTAMFAAASLPMFVVVSGSVTNDALIIFLSTAGAWWSLRVVRFGLRRFDPLLIGIILSAAVLTKITGLSLFGLVFVALIGAIRGGKITLRAALVTAMTAGLLTVMLSGWWYLRNLTLYGDPLATAATAELWGRQFGTAGESGGWAEIARIYNSFWLMIGHLHAPVWADIGFYGVTLALVGTAVAGWITPRRVNYGSAILVLPIAAALPIGLLLVGTKDVDISYGRLLFPGLIGFIALLVMGWRRLIGRFAPLFVLPLTFTALLMPSMLTAPAYPVLMPVDGLPASVVPLNVMSSGVRLDGYAMLDKTVSPDQSARAVVYFTPQSTTPTVFAVSLTEGTIRLGGLTRYAGMATGGMLRVGQMYRAVVSVRVDTPSANPAPHLTQFQIALFDAPESPALALTTPDGATVEVLTLDGAVYLDLAYQPPTPQTGYNATFGDVVRLDGYTLQGELTAGQTVGMVLDWRVIGVPPPDISATVQLLDAAGNLIAQYDDPSQGYPSRAWVTETALITRHTLTLPPDLPAGEYTLAVGWYRLDETFTRLPAAAPDITNQLAILRRVTITGYND